MRSANAHLLFLLQIARNVYIPHNPPAVIGVGGRDRCCWRPLLARQIASQASQAANRPARQGQPARLARRASRARLGPLRGPKSIHSPVLSILRSQSRTCFNSVSLKVSRHGQFFVPQRLREGQNGVCFNRGSCKMDKKYDFLERFVSFRMDETLLKQGRDAFWSFSSENVKDRCQSRPKFSRSRLSIGNFRQSRRCFSDGW